MFPIQNCKLFSLLMLICCLFGCKAEEVIGSLGAAAGVGLAGGNLKQAAAGATGSAIGSGGTRHVKKHLGLDEDTSSSASNGNGGGLTMLKKKSVSGEQMAVDGEGNVFVLIGGQWVKSND